MLDRASAAAALRAIRETLDRRTQGLALSAAARKVHWKAMDGGTKARGARLMATDRSVEIVLESIEKTRPVNVCSLTHPNREHRVTIRSSLVRKCPGNGDRTNHGSEKRTQCSLLIWSDTFFWSQTLHVLGWVCAGHHTARCGLRTVRSRIVTVVRHATHSSCPGFPCDTLGQAQRICVLRR